MQIRATLNLRNEKMLAARERLALSQLALAQLCGLGTTIIAALEKLDFTHSDVLAHAMVVAGALDLEPSDICSADAIGLLLPRQQRRVVEIEPRQLTSDMRTMKQLPSTLDLIADAENTESRKDHILTVLRTLTYREREVIKLRFGIGEEDGRTYSLAECAKIFDVTKERIRQVEARAIRKMQHPARAKRLEKFVLPE